RADPNQMPEAKRAKLTSAIEGDLDVIVEGKKFRVHSLILRLASPVFDKMLTTDMNESRRGEITLPDTGCTIFPW
ncbi:unnamed protein product, partial [Polarella glacialis]